MTLVYNPLFILKILKTYIYDLDRLWKIDAAGLKKLQDEEFKKIVKFAYTVPIYYKKYRMAGICPDDIRGTGDIGKLPIMSKNDLREIHPGGTISKRSRLERLIKVSTSGTTGKTLSLYVDRYGIILGLLGYLRALREYNINWRKTKITIIGDFAPHTAESGYVYRGLQSVMKHDFLFRNIQWLDTNDDPQKVIEQIDMFNPQFIGGYVGMLGHLALLKEQGLGKNISPAYIGSTGAVLSKNLRGYIENTFGAHVFEVYGATESGPIAIQCKRGLYHILSDFVYLEFNGGNRPNFPGKTGNLLVTKLYGKGTPIIRYDGICDIVIPLYEKCSCGMTGGLLEKIYGRSDLSIITLDGGILLPSSISDIFSRVLYELKSTMVKDTRVIQYGLDKIEIQLVLDKKYQKREPSVEKVFSVIMEGFREKVGSKVEIITKEVKKISGGGPRIITKLDRDKIQGTHYI